MSELHSCHSVVLVAAMGIYLQSSCAACDKHALTTCRFIVRDFEYDPKAIKVERDAKQRLEVELKKQFVSDFVTTVTVKSYSHSVYLHVICIFSL